MDINLHKFFQPFFDLAERFRNEQYPEAANRLGDELGRMVFGGPRASCKG